jgi:hypothetical protein
MACGVGACLGCMVRTGTDDRDGHTGSSRLPNTPSGWVQTCTCGPVFRAGEVDLGSDPE